MTTSPVARVEPFVYPTSNQSSIPMTQIPLVKMTTPNTMESQPEEVSDSSKKSKKGKNWINPRIFFSVLLISLLVIAGLSVTIAYLVGRQHCKLGDKLGSRCDGSNASDESGEEPRIEYENGAQRTSEKPDTFPTKPSPIFIKNEQTRRTRKQEKSRPPIAHLRLDLEETKNKSGVLVWQGGQFDDASFLHGNLTVLKSGAVKVGVAGIYEVKVHVCLDAVTNQMDGSVDHYHVRLSIIRSRGLSVNQKPFRKEVHYDKRTISRGTFDSQTAQAYVYLQKNDEIFILSTLRYLLKTSDCHSLDIALIEP